jgi:hypothetical protein
MCLMAPERTFVDGMTKAINIMMMEDSWKDLSTREISARILSEMGAPEKLNLLEGEVVRAYVVTRSKA